MDNPNFFEVDLIIDELKLAASKNTLVVSDVISELFPPIIPAKPMGDFLSEITILSLGSSLFSPSKVSIFSLDFDFLTYILLPSILS